MFGAIRLRLNPRLSLLQPPLRTSRNYSTTPRRSLSILAAERPAVSYLPWASGGALILATGALLATRDDTHPATSPSTPRHLAPDNSVADPLDQLDAKSLSSQSSHLAHLPLSRLIKNYTVYLVSSSSLLVNTAPTVLSFFGALRDSLPLLGPAAWWGISAFVRGTFFEQFAGGETAAECLETIRGLHEMGVGAMLSYSVEAEQHEGEQGEEEMMMLARKHCEETADAIRVAGSFAPNGGLRPTWVAIKGAFLPSVQLRGVHLTRFPTSHQSPDSWRTLPSSSEPVSPSRRSPTPRLPPPFLSSPRPTQPTTPSCTNPFATAVKSPKTRASA